MEWIGYTREIGIAHAVDEAASEHWLGSILAYMRTREHAHGVLAVGLEEKQRRRCATSIEATDIVMLSALLCNDDV